MNKDDALRALLVHVSIGGHKIGSLSQDDSLPGGYLGTTLAASLYPDAHLRWTKQQLELICKAVNKAPLPSHVKINPLPSHSKINHTY